MTEQIISFFEMIKDEKYVVLRNWEELYSDCSFDNDIDILCIDSEKIAKRLSLKPRSRRDDHIHYKYNDIKIDLWDANSGYYCEQWAKDAIRKRCFLNDLLYVPEKMDWLFLLIYHVVVQKEELPSKYKDCILLNVKQLNGECISYDRASLISLLESYMYLNKYKYTYSKFGLSNVNFREVDSSLIERDIYLKIKKAYCSVLNSIKGKAYKVIKWVRR